MIFNDLEMITIVEMTPDNSKLARVVNLFPEDIEDCIKAILARCGVYDTFIPQHFTFRLKGGDIE